MEEKMKENNEIKSTAHSKYRCQYHIVFAPKFRRKEIYGQLRKDIGEILRKLCEQKGVEIIEAEACPDHIHMLVSIPPYISIAQFMQGILRGHSRKKQESNCGIYPKPIRRRLYFGSNEGVRKIV